MSYALHPPISGDELPDLDFCVDTACSWEGIFPRPGKGDFLVAIESTIDGAFVLVSRRYTSAVNEDDAASIALDAFQERQNNYSAYVLSVRKVLDCEA